MSEREAQRKLFNADCEKLFNNPILLNRLKLLWHHYQKDEEGVKQDVIEAEDKEEEEGKHCQSEKQDQTFLPSSSSSSIFSSTASSSYSSSSLSSSCSCSSSYYSSFLSQSTSVLKYEDSKCDEGDSILLKLCAHVSEMYRKYPLLCKRGNRLDTTKREEKREIETMDNIHKGTTKKIKNEDIRSSHLSYLSPNDSNDNDDDEKVLQEEIASSSQRCINQSVDLKTKPVDLEGKHCDPFLPLDSLKNDDVELNKATENEENKEKEGSGERKENGEKEKEEEMEQNEYADTDCRRTMAIAYNKVTSRFSYALSGKLRHQGRTHASLWGKSLISGRSRGNCSEFRIANSTLLENEKLEDLILVVFDLVTGEAKERCRNCLYITQNTKCITDNLIFTEELLAKEQRIPTTRLKEAKDNFKKKQKKKNNKSNRKKRK